MSILSMKIVMCVQKSSSFRTLTHTLTRMENNKNNGIYQRNGMKKRCFSLFPVVKKNEKQRFLNLITRRSSVQIWLPQPKPHCTNDTIVQCFLFEKMPKMRGFFGFIKQKQPAGKRFPSRLFAFLKQ